MLASLHLLLGIITCGVYGSNEHNYSYGSLPGTLTTLDRSNLEEVLYEHLANDEVVIIEFFPVLCLWCEESLEDIANVFTSDDKVRLYRYQCRADISVCNKFGTYFFSTAVKILWKSKEAEEGPNRDVLEISNGSKKLKAQKYNVRKSSDAEQVAKILFDKPWHPKIIDKDSSVVKALRYILFKCGEEGLTVKEGEQLNSFMGVLMNTLKIVGTSDLGSFNDQLNTLVKARESKDDNDVLISADMFEDMVIKLNTFDVACEKPRCGELDLNAGVLWYLAHALSAANHELESGEISPWALLDEFRKVVSVCVPRADDMLWRCVFEPCNSVVPVLDVSIDKNDFVLWLWRVHNAVMVLNELDRIAVMPHSVKKSNVSGTTLYHDVRYPSAEECPNCRVANETGLKINDGLVCKFVDGSLTAQEVDVISDFNMEITEKYLKTVFINKNWYSEGVTAHWKEGSFSYAKAPVRHVKEGHDESHGKEHDKSDVKHESEDNAGKDKDKSETSKEGKTDDDKTKEKESKESDKHETSKKDTTGERDESKDKSEKHEKERESEEDGKRKDDSESKKTSEGSESKKTSEGSESKKTSEGSESKKTSEEKETHESVKSDKGDSVKKSKSESKETEIGEKGKEIKGSKKETESDENGSTSTFKKTMSKVKDELEEEDDKDESKIEGKGVISPFLRDIIA